MTEIRAKSFPRVVRLFFKDMSAKGSLSYNYVLEEWVWGDKSMSVEAMRDFLQGTLVKRGYHIYHFGNFYRMFRALVTSKAMESK